MKSTVKRLARTAGVLYLIVAIFGGFAEGFIQPKVYVAGDAARTAGNVMANAGLVRAGVVADLFQATVFVFLAMTLYLLLRHVNGSVAAAMVVLVAIATGIMCLNNVFEFEALRVATGAASVGTVAGLASSGVVLLLLDLQHYGLLIAQIFFGLWLIPLGFLAYKSEGMFPKWLGVLLMVGGVCYLLGVLASFLLVPALGRQVNTLVTIPSAIAELAMVAYLLVIGVRPAGS